ncbi:hypothetical protein CHS0354_001664, partial [Potamilus streckersoni]
GIYRGFSDETPSCTCFPLFLSDTKLSLDPSSYTYADSGNIGGGVRMCGPHRLTPSDEETPK